MPQQSKTLTQDEIEWRERQAQIERDGFVKRGPSDCWDWCRNMEDAPYLHKRMACGNPRCCNPAHVSPNQENFDAYKEYQATQFHGVVQHLKGAKEGKQAVSAETGSGGNATGGSDASQQSGTEAGQSGAQEGGTQTVVKKRGRKPKAQS